MAEEEGEEGDVAQVEEVKETPVALPVTFNLQKPGTLLMMLQVAALSMAHWNQALLTRRAVAAETATWEDAAPMPRSGAPTAWDAL
jgi:hypothetical protein